MTKDDIRQAIAEGRDEILTLCRLTSWRGILLRKKNKPGFKSLFHVNPVNDRPYIVVEEYYNYLIEYNKLKNAPQRKPEGR